MLKESSVTWRLSWSPATRLCVTLGNLLNHFVPCFSPFGKKNSTDRRVWTQRINVVKGCYGVYGYCLSSD